MQELKCFFCPNKSTLLATGGVCDDMVVECGSCSKYVLTVGAMNILKRSKNELKPLFFSNMRGWIHENQSSSPPRIDKETLEKIKNRKHMDVYEKAYRLLKWLHQKTDFPGQAIKIDDIYNDLKLPAICYANDRNEIEYLLRYLSEENYISSLQRRDITVEPKGFSYIQQYEKNTNSNLGFCAMWFDNSLKPAWDSAIEPAIIDAGYEAKRIDQHPHNSGVVDEILTLIRRSKFVVADLTGDRGGVYLEAGFAKGLGIEVIFTCRRDYFNNPNNIHFDVKHFNFVLWDEDKLDVFKKELSFRIQQTLGRGVLQEIK